MYKINEFSKIAGLPASTLRYYDREHILPPSYRHEDTGYRYYSETDYEKAKLLAVLRDNQFTIAEIKDITATISSFDDLTYYLSEKKQAILDDIEILQKQVNKLEKMMTHAPLSPPVQDYAVSTADIQEQLYIYRRFAGPYDDIGEEIRILYEAAGGVASGEVFQVDAFQTNSEPFKICLPVTRKIASDDVKTDTLPARTGLQVIHTGSYHTIGEAYKCLIDYVNTHGINTADYFFTRFVKGPGKIFKGNEQHYVTEITLLLKEKIEKE